MMRHSYEEGKQIVRLNNHEIFSDRTINEEEYMRKEAMIAQTKHVNLEHDLNDSS